MGRVVRPIKNHAAQLAEILADPQFSHIYFDISWDEVAKYVVSSPEATRITADLINRYPDRFLFGTDEVAPSSQEQYFEGLLPISNRCGTFWTRQRPRESAQRKLRADLR